MDDLYFKEFKNELKFKMISIIILTCIALLFFVYITIAANSLGMSLAVILYKYLEYNLALIIVLVASLIYHLIRGHYKIYKPYFIANSVCILILAFTFLFY